jgi:hypothetical protein
MNYFTPPSKEFLPLRPFVRNPYERNKVFWAFLCPILVSSDKEYRKIQAKFCFTHVSKRYLFFSDSHQTRVPQQPYMEILYAELYPNRTKMCNILASC